MNSGVGKIAQNLPGIGRYARAIDKGADLGKAVSDGIDSFGGAQGIARGVEGAIHDPRTALDMVMHGGGGAVTEGFRAAAGNLAEQVGLGEMSPEGRLKARVDLGRMATVGVELVASGGISALAMATEAAAAGATAGIQSATKYAHSMPSQFANIPQQSLTNNDPWSPKSNQAIQQLYGSQSSHGSTAGATAGYTGGYPDSAW